MLFGALLKDTSLTFHLVLILSRYLFIWLSYDPEKTFVGFRAAGFLGTAFF